DRRQNYRMAKAFPPDIPLDGYGDMHKIVLQGLMAAGYLDLKGVKHLFNAACDYLKVSDAERAERTAMPYVQQVVRGINEQMKPFDMAVKSASCEITGKKYFIFLVTAEKSVMKHQLMFTPQEIKMLQICIDRILRKYPNFAIPQPECVNTWRDVDPRGSVSKGEEFIKRLIELQYLTKYPISKTDYDVTLGVRGLRELEPLLMDFYQDVIQTCCLCKMLLLHGFRCPKCKLLLHKFCYTKYLQTCQTCKSCNASWASVKDMLRRNRVTDEIIANEGPDIDLSDYRPSRIASMMDEPPRLEPQVSGTSSRRGGRW
ncbi:unnamed protein product, partial [Allacma fusca]